LQVAIISLQENIRHIYIFTLGALEIERYEDEMNFTDPIQNVRYQQMNIKTRGIYTITMNVSGTCVHSEMD
jgi:hypothetical protein